MNIINPYILFPSATTSGTTTTYIDIGFRRSNLTEPTVKSPSLFINDITNLNLTISNLVDINASTTGYGITVTNNAASGLDNGDLTGNTTIFSDQTLDTNQYAIKPTAETITLTGIPEGASIVIRVMGTMSTGATNFNRLTRLTLHGEVLDFDAYQRTSVVRFPNTGSITSQASNVITWEAVGTAGANNFGVLSAIRLEITV